MDQPAFTCSPPCNVKIPPWTGATSTVNYPLLTVSDGTWISTITKTPLTISEWVFEVVTLTDSSNGIAKRQNPPAFWPVPAKTSSWPAVVYSGPDENPTTVDPTGPFPTPPPSIGPGAPPPPMGSWPKRDIQPNFGFQDLPFVDLCGYFDPTCVQQPWLYGDGIGGDSGPFVDGSLPGDDDDGNDENWREYLTQTSSTTTTTTRTTTRTTTTTTIPPSPEPSPREGDPIKDERHCYDGGITEIHVRLDNAANSFCNGLGSAGAVLAGGTFAGRDFTFDQSTTVITISLDIQADCQWTWNYDQCRRYIGVGVDGKQGGWVQNDCYTWRIDPNYSW